MEHEHMAIESIAAAVASIAQSAAPGLGTAERAGGTGDIASITGESGSGLDFGATLNKLVSAVESSNVQANQATLGMVDGTTDVHDAMIALQRADMTFQMTVQIRNKLVSAYQEMMRMPL
jgi:flagellar hook-basal body complex protein FliE